MTSIYNLFEVFLTTVDTEVGTEATDGFIMQKKPYSIFSTVILCAHLCVLCGKFLFVYQTANKLRCKKTQRALLGLPKKPDLYRYFIH